MPSIPPWQDTCHDLNSLAALREVYGTPADPSLFKEADHLHPVYQPYIKAATFAILATCGPEGLDASPRGDAAGFLQVADPHTLLLPDRRGNNRTDSLNNVVFDPQVALLLLVPGCGETLRINGRARISAAPALLERFAVQGALPRSVLVIHVEAVYFQCARAILRSQLWTRDQAQNATDLPTPGQILRTLSNDRFDGASYDAALRPRQQGSLY